MLLSCALNIDIIFDLKLMKIKLILMVNKITPIQCVGLVIECIKEKID